MFPQYDTVGAAGEQTVRIVGQNYAFEGVPEQAAVDTRLRFRNGAEEPHELVLLRPNEDAPPVEGFVRENFSGPPEGPPPENFGPPHAAQGMFASIEVEG